MPKAFLDTNVFVYAIDECDPRKHEIARNVIETFADAGEAVVSTQILHEFYVVATRKLGHDAIRVKSIVQEIAQNEVAAIDVALIERAIDISVLHRLSFWDSLLVAAACATNCAELLTEDLQHDLVVAGIRIRNPFRD